MNSQIATADDLQVLHEQHRIEQFLFREARLMDTRCYADWEALWEDDGVYWVPANGDNPDTDWQVSIIYDNRKRMHTRVERFTSGLAHSQEPSPRTSRVIANVEIEYEDEVRVVHSTFQLAESRPGARVEWAGRTTHRLTERDGELRIAHKKVVLVDNDQVLTTLDFLL